MRLIHVKVRRLDLYAHPRQILLHHLGIQVEGKVLIQLLLFEVLQEERLEQEVVEGVGEQPAEEEGRGQADVALGAENEGALIVEEAVGDESEEEGGCAQLEKVLTLDVVELLVVVLGQVGVELDQIGLGVPWHIVPFESVDHLEDISVV